MEQRGFAWLSLGIAAGALALLGGCDVVDPFAGYRDSGVNFIAGQPLAAPPLATDATNLGGSGFWDFAWRDPAVTTYDYMTLASSAELGPTGALDAWELTLANLALNGDFESFGVGATPAPWSYGGGAGLYSATVQTAGAIHNKSLELNIDTNTWAGFAIDELMLDYGQPGSKFYRYNFNAKGPANVKYGLSPDTNLGPLLNLPGDMFLATSWGPISGATYRLAFGNAASSVNSFFIDDLRAIRSDLETSNYSLRLRLRKSDASPALSAGFYGFTLYVKKPSTAKYSTEARTNEALAAQYITIFVRQLSAQGTVLATPIKMTFPVTATWQQVTASGVNFDIFHADPSAAVMEIRIAPFDYIHNAPDPGSVIIARPELHFYLNGY
ncbi:MAG: hypothetical protein JNG85_01870 [Spirochaetaceae bacterium]|nr:hypothetical protein [Spirochaetaceae bacterium]